MEGKPRRRSKTHCHIAQGWQLRVLCMSYPLWSPRTRRPCGCQRAFLHPAQRPCSHCTLAADSTPLPLPVPPALARGTSRLHRAPHYDAHGLAAESTVACERGLVKLSRWSYIWLTEPATSGHNRSISSFNRRRAKERKAGSGSARNPTMPAAEVRPTIVAGWTALIVSGCCRCGACEVEAGGSCCGSR
jgi:hypothetical protein